jgi:hypothetical protein
LRIDEQDAGKKVRCPQCGMIQAVTTDAAADPDAAGPWSGTAPDAGIPDFERETVYRAPDEHQPVVLGEPQPAGSMDRGSTELWYLKTPDGTVYGPAPRAVLNQWSGEGRISAECLIRRDDHSHWQSAVTLFPGLMRLAATRKKVEPSAGQQTPVRRPMAVAGPTGLQPNRGLPILVLAVVGFMMPFFPVFSLIALIWAHQERRRIETGQVSDHSRWRVDVGYFAGLAGSLIGFFGVPSCLSLSG